MRQLFWAIILALATTCPVWAAPQDAVVRLTSHGASGTVIWTGQGRTWILSCAHAFEGADRTKRLVIDAPAPAAGATSTPGGPRLARVDYKRDLSLILLPSGPLPYSCPVAEAGFRPGRCLSVGYDEMRDRATVAWATILSTSGRETYTKEQPWHGRSGGALIDHATGKLVGVVQGYETNPATGRFDRSCRGVYGSLASIHAFLWPTTTAPPPRTFESRSPGLPGSACPGGVCPR